MVGFGGVGVVSHSFSGAPANTNLKMTIKESSDIPLNDYLKNV